MKCVQALAKKENIEGKGVRIIAKVRFDTNNLPYLYGQQYDLVILGGLSGRLDQTVHTLSYLHKLRKVRRTVYTVTDDNIAWLLDEVITVIHVLIL